MFTSKVVVAVVQHGDFGAEVRSAGLKKYESGVLNLPP